MLTWISSNLVLDSGFRKPIGHHYFIYHSCLMHPTRVFFLIPGMKLPLQCGESYNNDGPIRSFNPAGVFNLAGVPSLAIVVSLAGVFTLTGVFTLARVSNLAGVFSPAGPNQRFQALGTL
jgi:hypothetical protein